VIRDTIHADEEVVVEMVATGARPLLLIAAGVGATPPPELAAKIESALAT